MSGTETGEDGVEPQGSSNEASLSDGANQARKLSFPPVPNGVDYLVSVVDLLAHDQDDPRPRDLKYAVLHLQAASEVLLKARLQFEHWTLVVADAAKTRTKKQQYLDGDFISASHEETIRRLVDVVGVEIGEPDRKALSNLVKTRNALQHWGLTELAPAVEARAATVLDFLIRFLDEQLLCELSESERAGIDDDLVQIREGLAGIETYVSKRMKRVRATLKEVAARTIQCPDCTQFALVIDSVERRCHFCSRLWEPEALAEAYASEILNFSWHDIRKGADPIVVGCPQCDCETLVLETLTAAQPDQPVAFCFMCAEILVGLDTCTRCSRLFQPSEEEIICGHCWAEVINSD